MRDIFFTLGAGFLLFLFRYSQSRNNNIKDRIASRGKIEFPRKRMATFLAYFCMSIILFGVYHIASIIVFILAFVFMHLLFWKHYYKEKNRLVIDKYGIINSTGFISGSRILWEDIAVIEFKIIGNNNRFINIVPYEPNKYWSPALLIQIDNDGLMKILQKRLERYKRGQTINGWSAKT